jgi:hypothetical protein
LRIWFSFEVAFSHPGCTLEAAAAKAAAKKAKEELEKKAAEGEIKFV